MQRAYESACLFLLGEGETSTALSTHRSQDTPETRRKKSPLRPGRTGGVICETPPLGVPTWGTFGHRRSDCMIGQDPSGGISTAVQRTIRYRQAPRSTAVVAEENPGAQLRLLTVLRAHAVVSLGR